MIFLNEHTIYVNRGSVYYQMGVLDLTAQDLETDITLNVKSTKALSNLGITL